jgi:uncharacterized protein YjlB
MTSPTPYRFIDDGRIPNSPLPFLHYRHVVPADPAAIEALLARNGWPPAWRNGIHPFHHFHSTAHEALGIARGSARVLFGGPGGQELALEAGDLVVVPAGVGHCAIAASPDLLVVGAYPAGMGAQVNMHRGDPKEIDTVRRAVAQVPAAVPDPLEGETGPLTQLWNT